MITVGSKSKNKTIAEKFGIVDEGKFWLRFSIFVFEYVNSLHLKNLSIFAIAVKVILYFPFLL